MRRLRNDSGLALATVLVTILMLSMFTALLLRQAVTQRQQSEFQAREDVVVAGAEAMLERYAAKLTVDPLYFIHWVDEGEHARVCDKPASAGYGQPAVQPGKAWPWSDCEVWTYEDPDRDGDGNPDLYWYVHPVLDGTVAAARDDIGVLLEVSRPARARSKCWWSGRGAIGYTGVPSRQPFRQPLYPSSIELPRTI